MNTNNKSQLGLLGTLQIIFLVLKLTGNIDWEWFWVLSPTILPIGIVLAFVVIATIVVTVGVGLGIWDYGKLAEKYKTKDDGKE